MAIIKNPTVRLFWMPRRPIGEGKAHGGRLMLHAQSQIEVPDAYVAALLEEKNSKGAPTGWALRLVAEGKGVFSVKHPKGAAGLFEQRILALRQQAAEATERARIEAGKADDALKRASAAEKKNAELEARLAELETLVASASAKGAASKSEPKDTSSKK